MIGIIRKDVQSGRLDLRKRRKKGKEYISETRARLIGAAPGGCPFAGHRQFGEGD